MAATVPDIPVTDTTGVELPIAAAELPAAKDKFLQSGFLQVNDVLTGDEIAFLSNVYDKFLDGSLDVHAHRYDLGSAEPRKGATENITQIMWPSDIHPPLRDHILRRRTLALVRALYGDDTFDFDFDMLICKFPHTNTPTPAHQDEAYWIPLPDKRAVSVWVALDESTLDNGCMWYGAETHTKPLRPHYKAGAADNAALQCDAHEAEMTPMPLRPGGAGLHAGRTLHYSRGNTTDTMRRAYILNFRPRAAIEYERVHGFDHGRSGHKQHEVRSKDEKPEA